MKISMSSKELFDLIPIKKFGGKKTINNNEILVTGGAGFLGIHLLKSLYEAKKYSKIYTIVRNENKLYEQAKYFNLNVDWLKDIVIIKGDLLDLNEEDYPNVEFVIHSAAQIHCIKTLKQLWNNNVELVSKINQIYQNNKLYFISTLSVFVSSNKIGNHKENTLEVNDEYYLYGGYSQSKYIAEKITEQYNQKIIRLGLITGSSKVGKFPDDFFVSFVKELKNIGYYPENYQEALVDMTPVDLASENIINVIHKQEKNIIHIANKEGTQLSNFINILNLKKISKEDWLNKINELDNLKQFLLKFAFFKDEMLKSHFNYFNLDLFQTTNHSYNIKNKFEMNNENLLKLYCDEITKDKNDI